MTVLMWDGGPLLTAAEAWRDQDDLVKLCADRPLDTVEIFSPNGFYGYDQLLKRYAGLPSTYPLKAVVPHGTIIDPGFVWKAERDASLPGVLCWERHRQPLYEAAGGKLVLPGASPYLYLTQMLAQAAPAERAGTLFFPSHSTHHVDDEADYDLLAVKLASLPPELAPVVVCMYWRDLHLGREAPFRHLGLQVVSAGHMYDPDFPARLHHLLTRFRYAAGNEFGTHMFQAVASGCTYFHVGNKSAIDHDALLRRREPDGVPWIAPDYAIVRPLYQEMSECFGAPLPGDFNRQQGLTRNILGGDRLQSPIELRRTFEHLEVLDRWGSWGPGVPAPGLRATPKRFERSFRRLRSLVPTKALRSLLLAKE